MAEMDHLLHSAGNRNKDGGMNVHLQGGRKPWLVPGPGFARYGLCDLRPLFTSPASFPRVSLVMSKELSSSSHDSL